MQNLNTNQCLVYGDREAKREKVIIRTFCGISLFVMIC
jgi:hypothetical protein